MDWLHSWLLDENNKIMIGWGAKVVVDWLTTNLSSFFDAIAAVLQSSIDAILWLLLGRFVEETAIAPYYPFITIAAFCLIAWAVRR